MYEYRCKVVKVIDGDTVDVDIDLGFGIWQMDERVRIMGIDTPESRTRDKVEKAFALAAKAKLKELLKKFESNIIYNADLKKKNWFNIGGKAKVFFKANELKELVKCTNDCWQGLSKSSFHRSSLEKRSLILSLLSEITLYDTFVDSPFSSLIFEPIKVAITGFKMRP